MEKIASILTERLLQRKRISEAQLDIYKYGLQIGLEVLLNTIVSLLIACMLDMVLETVVFFLIFIPLRSYAGGIHMASYWSCFWTSCFFLVCALMTIKYVEIGSAAVCTLWIISLIIVKLLAPVEDENRPLKAAEKAFFSRKLNKTIAGIAMIFCVSLLGKFSMVTKTVTASCFVMVLVLILGAIKNICKKGHLSTV